MSVTQAFVGDEEAIRNLEADEQPSRRLSGVDIKGLDVPKLARLHEVLCRRQEGSSAEFPQVRAVGKDGPFIHRLPADLRDSLTFLGTYGMVDCAARWSGTEECTAARLDSDTLQAVLQELVDLANSAKMRGKDMYVWRGGASGG